MGPNLGRGGGFPSTRRNEASSSAEAGNDSSFEKSKTESDGFLDRAGLLKVRVQSAIRPNLSARENGAKGTLRGRLEVVVGVVALSGGPHPSGLNGTPPTSKPSTMADGFERFGKRKLAVLTVEEAFSPDWVWD